MEPHIPKYVPVTNVVVKLFTRLGLKTGQARSTPVTPSRSSRSAE